MASAAPRKNVKKTLLLEEMVHGVLESDKDVCLSEFIEYIGHSEHLKHSEHFLTLVFLLYLNI